MHELDDVLHATNMYLKDVVDKDEVPLDSMASVRFQQAINEANGILPYPMLLGETPVNFTEEVAMAMTHLFCLRAKKNAEEGYDPFDGLDKFVANAIYIGTMMGYQIGLAMQQCSCEKDGLVLLEEDEDA